VGLTTVPIDAIAIRVDTTAVKHALAIGEVFIRGHLERPEVVDRDRFSEVVDIEPDTARIVDIDVVPVALDGVARHPRVDVVRRDVNGQHTPVSDLEIVVILTSIIIIVAGVVVTVESIAVERVIVQTPSVPRDLVTIAERGPIELAEEIE